MQFVKADHGAGKKHSLDRTCLADHAGRVGRVLAGLREGDLFCGMPASSGCKRVSECYWGPMSYDHRKSNSLQVMNLIVHYGDLQACSMCI